MHYMGAGGVAIVVQAVVLLVMAFTMLRIKKQVSALVEKVEPVLDDSGKLLVEVRESLARSPPKPATSSM